MTKDVQPILWSLVLLAVGCQGLTPGKMEWVQPHSESQRAGNAYLIRGLIGVFSTGMDELQAKLETAGVRSRVYQDNQHSYLADAIVKEYKGVKNPEPLCLIGHSYGADDVVRVARVLNEHGIKVDMLVTFDATVPPEVPPNVKVAYNYYQSQVTDVIPMFRGIPLKLEVPNSGKLVNMDLRKDRQDLLVSGTNHINIDKNELVHKEVVSKALETCPPRDVWASRNGRTVLPDGARIGVVETNDAQPASHVEGARR